MNYASRYNVVMENFGLQMEGVAAQYLQTVRGWRLIDKRVRFREGEIDLIMEAGGELRFVEVKGRRNEKFGGVVESVTTLKIRRLKRAIYRWRERSGDGRFGQIIFVGILVDGKGALTIEEHLIE
jgi:putative endonuclease